MNSGEKKIRPAVLLVDDDASFARDVTNFLGADGTVFWVHRSDQALAFIQRERPDWILLDLNMPRHLSRLDEEEGLELLKRISTPIRERVIVVTAALSAGMNRRLKYLGVERVHLKSEPLPHLLGLLGGHGRSSVQSP